MVKILVVDDEARLRKIISDFLKMKGYTVVEAEDGEAALEKFFGEKDISLIILDVMMPKLDGWEVLKEIRSYSDLPVIMLTARGEEDDELHGFSIGADDYISKPFRPKVLLARIDALLKRNSLISDGDFKVGEIEISTSAHTVKVCGKNIELSFKEFELLKFFIENKGLALTREKILNNVWDFDYYGDERTVDTHVKKLRSKLLECSYYIKTVRGVGYKFTTEQEEAE